MFLGSFLPDFQPLVLFFGKKVFKKKKFVFLSAVVSLAQIAFLIFENRSCLATWAVILAKTPTTSHYRLGGYSHETQDEFMGLFSRQWAPGAAMGLS